MPSDLQITNIKDQANANSAITIASDGQITVNQNNPTLTLGSNATGFTGVKIADQWRLTTSFTGTATPITNASSNKMERVDTAGQGTVGSPMTVDTGGIFTFPMTGIYWVMGVLGVSNASESDFIALNINSVISGTSTTLTNTYCSIPGPTGTTYTNVTNSTLFDCTNVSTHKVSFSVNEDQQGASGMSGSGSTNNCHFTFIRLGDT
tara:strand:+ start:3984 stop:4604 length:621 start_codon:yes stop_codon:yes gene_type:complete